MTAQTHFPIRKRQTVLLIGHGLGALKRVAFSLQRSGHSIIWADDGATGLRTAEAERPDFIICETVLVDVSGFEVCRKLKSSLLPDTPLVLMGRLGDEPTDLPRAFRAGADEYFARTTDWQHVLENLQTVIRMKAMKPDPSYSTKRVAEIAEICFE